jgi:hypothetical protein
MGRLVGIVMIALLISLIVQAISGDEPLWVSIISIPAALLGIGFAAARIFAQARRLGARTDPPSVQSDLARSIFNAHLICLAAMATVLTVQLAAM